MLTGRDIILGSYESFETAPLGCAFVHGTLFRRISERLGPNLGPARHLRYCPYAPRLPAGPTHLRHLVPDLAVIPAQPTRDFLYRDAANEHLAQGFHLRI